MRILLATKHFGGAGGIQRHVAATIRCLGARHEIDVCARRIEPGEYGELPPSGGLVPSGEWRNGGSRRARARQVWARTERTVFRKPPPYDVYLHYQYSEWLGRRFPAALSFAVPCGNSVAAYEADCDVVLLEAPDNVKWVGDPTKAALVPPPLEPPSVYTEPVDDVPEDFYLTVFNSHSPGKGLDDLVSVAARSPIPFVWCRSTLWQHPEPHALPGVVAMDDLRQAQLRSLYERCRAYISFDRNPGFGWALADALQYGAPALTRPHGVMTLPDLDTTATWTYDSLDDLVELLHHSGYEHVERNLTNLSPDRFVERFEELVASARRS